MNKIHLPVRAVVDAETYDYLDKTAKKRGVSVFDLVSNILQNEKEKAKRRPKVAVEKE